MRKEVTQITRVTMSRKDVLRVLANYLTNELSMDIKPDELEFITEPNDIMLWDVTELVYRKDEKL